MPAAFSLCRRSAWPGGYRADSAVIAAVAFAAPGWNLARMSPLEGLTVDQSWAGSPQSAQAYRLAGRGLLNALVPYVIGRVGGLPGGPGQLVSARAGAASVVAPDHGEHAADRAVLLLVSGLAA